MTPAKCPQDTYSESCNDVVQSHDELDYDVRRPAALVFMRQISDSYDRFREAFLVDSHVHESHSI